jgi:hypothetical protein
MNIRAQQAECLIPPKAKRTSSTKEHFYHTKLALIGRDYVHSMLTLADLDQDQVGSSLDQPRVESDLTRPLLSDLISQSSQIAPYHSLLLEVSLLGCDCLEETPQNRFRKLLVVIGAAAAAATVVKERMIASVVAKSVLVEQNMIHHFAGRLFVAAEPSSPDQTLKHGLVVVTPMAAV